MKLTFIWQTPYFAERDWVARLFEPLAGEQLYDGKHQLVRDNSLLIDSYLHCRPREYYSQFRGKNAFLLHLCDETYEGGYEAYDNFRGVFRCYWSGVFNKNRLVQIPLGYSAGFIGGSSELGTARRPYLWSFLGGADKSSRPEMIKALLPIQPHFVHITDPSNTTRLGKLEYEQVLRDSIFVPSSMGNVNLECFRVYEALECGAIPILEKRIGMDYFRELLGDHPMPTFTNWKQAAGFLSAIKGDVAALNKLQEDCSEWWTGYKRSFTEKMISYVDSPLGEEAGKYINWQRAIPGSQIIELLRHHTIPAFGRRVMVQLMRLTKEGKLRKTTGA